jgi:hypothetical protein
LVIYGEGKDLVIINPDKEAKEIIERALHRPPPLIGEWIPIYGELNQV